MGVGKQGLQLLLRQVWSTSSTSTGLCCEVSCSTAQTWFQAAAAAQSSNACCWGCPIKCGAISTGLPFEVCRAAQTSSSGGAAAVPSRAGCCGCPVLCGACCCATCRVGPQAGGEEIIQQHTRRPDSHYVYCDIHVCAKACETSTVSCQCGDVSCWYPSCVVGQDAWRHRA